MSQFQKIARMAIALCYAGVGVIGAIGLIEGKDTGVPLIVWLAVWALVVVTSWNVFEQMIREKKSK